MLFHHALDQDQDQSGHTKTFIWPPWPTNYTTIRSLYSTVSPVHMYTVDMYTYYNIIIISIHAVCNHTPLHEQIIHAVECLHM